MAGTSNTTGQAKPEPYPLSQLEGVRSATGIILPILTAFVAVLLVGGGGIFLTYTLMNDDEVADADSPGPGTSRDPGGFDNPNPQINPRTTSPLAVKVETIDDAIAALRSSSSSKRGEGAQWLATQSLDGRRQAEIAGLLNAQLLRDRYSENDTLDALLVWGSRDSLPSLRMMLEGRRGDANKVLQLLTKFPDQEFAELIAKHLESPATTTNAIAALKAIGAPASTAVARYLGSSNRTADDNARQLLQSWGIDVQDALVDRYIQDLQATDSTTRGRAARELAAATVIESRKDDVARALNAMLLTTSDVGKVDALRAVKSWGGMNSLSAIIQVAKGGGLESSTLAIDMLAEIQDPRAAEALCDLLANYSRRQKAKASLVKMPRNVAEKAVVKYFNHSDAATRQEARLLLHSYETDDSLILDQCVADLRSADLDQHVGAVEWLSTMRIVEARRSELADLLVAMLDKSDSRLRTVAPVAFARWATEKHAERLYPLLGANYTTEVRIAALKILVMAGDIKLLAPQLDKILASTTMRGSAITVLDAAGPAVEDLMIYMLESSNQEVLALTCEYLFHHGTAKSQQPLLQFRTAATRDKKPLLVDAARRASTEITVRTRKQSESANGG